MFWRLEMKMQKPDVIISTNNDTDSKCCLSFFSKAIYNSYMWCLILACCAAITELVLNDTNAHQVVQVKYFWIHLFVHLFISFFKFSHVPLLDCRCKMNICKPPSFTLCVHMCAPLRFNLYACMIFVLMCHISSFGRFQLISGKKFDVISL